MLGKRILVIEDDLYVRHMMRDLLTRAGSQVCCAEDGTGGLQALFNEQPDLVILDVNMHHQDGWGTFERIKVMTETPVIILASGGNEGANERAISMGAADFIDKPLKARALLARTKSVLERRKQGEPGPHETNYEDHYLSIDTNANRVTVRGKRVRLTKTELGILNCLVSNAALLVTFEEILQEVWGPGYEDSIDYVHVYISRLRRKIEEKLRRPVYITSEHGLGYRFNALAQ